MLTNANVEAPGKELPPPPDALMVMLLAVLSVVIVTFVPATRVRVLDVEAGVTLVWPLTAYELNKFWSPLLVPDRLATAELANMVLDIAPAAILVALPTDVTVPVRLALVTTVAAKLPVPLPVTPPIRVIV